MTFEAIIADVAFKAPIVAFLKSDQVVMDMGCQVDLAMQMTQPLGAIELKDQSTPRQLYAFLGFGRALDYFQRDRANASLQLLPEAGAQRTLEAVSSRPLILIEAPSSAYRRGMLSLDHSHSHEEETSCASTPPNPPFPA